MNSRNNHNSKSTPDFIYKALFRDIQLSRIFEDSKTFVDATAKSEPNQILDLYNKNKSLPTFNLKEFVTTHFILPTDAESKIITSHTKMEEHISALWPKLTRKTDLPNHNSLLTLPHPYVVAGGRFEEMYYWDSFFIMLGLKAKGDWKMIENMVDNCAYLLQQFGHIPNGTRSYYLGRSQPPFFSQMVNLLAQEYGDKIWLKYQSSLLLEYQFWMKGEKMLINPAAQERVVKLNDSSIMNRYWDNENGPRPESYREDIDLVAKQESIKKEKYKHIRAACESGWDFSSRWLLDGADLSSIRTTDIIPVDLNCLLYDLEIKLAKSYLVSNNMEAQKFYYLRSMQRKGAIKSYCWGENANFFTDYDFKAAKSTNIYSLAGLFPLYFNVANKEQAAKVAKVISDCFLQSGGLLTTLEYTQQQWDAPNGWAPMHWIAIEGLKNYGFIELAEEIKNRWLSIVVKVFKRSGKLYEKYNVVDWTQDGGGGEYPLQDGFGWTNAIALYYAKENLAQKKHKSL